MDKKQSLTILNFLLFIIGMIGVWFTTYSLIALLFTFIASLHITVKVNNAK